MEIFNFPNIGMVKTKISDELKKNLINDFDLNLPKKTTGLEGSNIPNHYYITDSECFRALSEVLLECTNFYNKSFPIYIHRVKKMIGNEIIENTHLTVEREYCWYNEHKPNFFTPIHTHWGIFSFVLWLKIPYNAGDNKFSGNLSFLHHDIMGQEHDFIMANDQEKEGTLLFFPSNLTHCVYPFDHVTDTRLSLSGNITIKLNKTLYANT